MGLGKKSGGERSGRRISRLSRKTKLYIRLTDLLIHMRSILASNIVLNSCCYRETYKTLLGHFNKVLSLTERVDSSKYV